MTASIDITDLESLLLPGLKEKAEELGVKVAGQGWSTCCPPTGKRADIIKAIRRHQDQDAASQDPDPEDTKSSATPPRGGHQGTTDPETPGFVPKPPRQRSVPIKSLCSSTAKGISAAEMKLINDIINQLPPHEPNAAWVSPGLIGSLGDALLALESNELEIPTPQICTSFAGPENRSDNVGHEEVKARRMRADAKNKQTISLFDKIAGVGSKGGKSRIVDDRCSIYVDFEQLELLGFNDRTPGNEWKLFYYVAQQIAPVLLFCVSRRWNASQWCHEELERCKKIYHVERASSIEDAYFVFFDMTEDVEAGPEALANWSKLCDDCTCVADRDGSEDCNERYFAMWGGDKTKKSLSERRRLLKMLSERNEDGLLEPSLSRKGYSVLLQHLLRCVISNYEALGSGTQRSLQAALSD